MKLTHVYRIKPNTEQVATMDLWLELLRGKRGGRPKFKKFGEMRSFTFPRVNSEKAGANISDRVLTLSKIGAIPIVLHRPIPDGFVPKTCTIVKKADGRQCMH